MDDPIRLRGKLMTIGVERPAVVVFTVEAPFNDQTVHLMQLIGQDFSVLIVADEVVPAEPKVT